MVKALLESAQYELGVKKQEATQNHEIYQKFNEKIFEIFSMKDKLLNLDLEKITELRASLSNIETLLDGTENLEFKRHIDAFIKSLDQIISGKSSQDKTERLKSSISEFVDTSITLVKAGNRLVGNVATLLINLEKVKKLLGSSDHDENSDI